MHSRELEQIVALFEQALSHHPDVKVSSPAYIQDRDTNEKREVDVLISGIIGTVPIFCIVECRAHQRPQTVQWIEQVYTKKSSVGASEAIAVSSSGFSKQALDKAQHLGVKTRTVNELDVPNIRKMLGPKKIIGVQRRARFKEVLFDIVSFDTGLKNVNAPSVKQNFLIDTKYNREYSLFDLLDSQWSNYKQVFEEFNIGLDDSVDATATVRLPMNRFRIMGQQTAHYVKGCTIRMEVYMLRVNPKFKFGHTYGIGEKTAYRLGYNFNFPHAEVGIEVIGEVLPPGKGWLIHGTAIREFKQPSKRKIESSNEGVSSATEK